MRQHSLMMRVGRVRSMFLKVSGGLLSEEEEEEERVRRSRGWM